jgi:hypothetical protein
MATSKRARRTARRRQQARRTQAARRRNEVRALRAAPDRRTYALVAGERPDLVLRGLQALQRSGHIEEGMDGELLERYDLTVSPDDVTMGPFVRALMRVEAELILRDADALACVALMRTDEERRADALLLLARRVCEEICRDRPEVSAVA